MRCQRSMRIKAEGDVQTGVNILRRALEERLRGIVSNAGMDGGVAMRNWCGALRPSRRTPTSATT